MIEMHTFNWLEKKENLIVFKLRETGVFKHKNGWTDFRGLGPEQTPLNSGFIFPISKREMVWFYFQDIFFKLENINKIWCQRLSGLGRFLSVSLNYASLWWWRQKTGAARGYFW